MNFPRGPWSEEDIEAFSKQIAASLSSDDEEEVAVEEERENQNRYTSHRAPLSGKGLVANNEERGLGCDRFVYGLGGDRIYPSQPLRPISNVNVGEREFPPCRNDELLRSGVLPLPSMSSGGHGNGMTASRGAGAQGSRGHGGREYDGVGTRRPSDEELASRWSGSHNHVDVGGHSCNRGGGHTAPLVGSGSFMFGEETRRAPPRSAPTNNYGRDAGHDDGYVEVGGGIGVAPGVLEAGSSSQRREEGVTSNLFGGHGPLVRQMDRQPNMGYVMERQASNSAPIVARGGPVQMMDPNFMMGLFSQFITALQQQGYMQPGLPSAPYSTPSMERAKQFEFQRDDGKFSAPSTSKSKRRCYSARGKKLMHVNGSGEDEERELILYNEDNAEMYANDAAGFAMMMQDVKSLSKLRQKNSTHMQIDVSLKRDGPTGLFGRSCGDSNEWTQLLAELHGVVSIAYDSEETSLGRVPTVNFSWVVEKSLQWFQERNFHLGEPTWACRLVTSLEGEEHRASAIALCYHLVVAAINHLSNRRKKLRMVKKKLDSDLASKGSLIELGSVQQNTDAAAPNDLLLAAQAVSSSEVEDESGAGRNWKGTILPRKDIATFLQKKIQQQAYSLNIAQLNKIVSNVSKEMECLTPNKSAMERNVKELIALLAWAHPHLFYDHIGIAFDTPKNLVMTANNAFKYLRACAMYVNGLVGQSFKNVEDALLVALKQQIIVEGLICSSAEYSNYQRLIMAVTGADTFDLQLSWNSRTLAWELPPKGVQTVVDALSACFKFKGKREYASKCLRIFDALLRFKAPCAFLDLPDVTDPDMRHLQTLRMLLRDIGSKDNIANLVQAGDLLERSQDVILHALYYAWATAYPRSATYLLNGIEEALKTSVPAIPRLFIGILSLCFNKTHQGDDGVPKVYYFQNLEADCHVRLSKTFMTYLVNHVGLPTTLELGIPGWKGDSAPIDDDEETWLEGSSCAEKKTTSGCNKRSIIRRSNHGDTKDDLPKEEVVSIRAARSGASASMQRLLDEMPKPDIMSKVLEVGDWVIAYWIGSEPGWYNGKAVSIDSEKNNCNIKFDDGDVIDLLPLQFVKFNPLKLNNKNILGRKLTLVLGDDADLPMNNIRELESWFVAAVLGDSTTTNSSTVTTETVVAASEITPLLMYKTKDNNKRKRIS